MLMFPSRTLHEYQFEIPPHQRFVGKPGEQFTMFFYGTSAPRSGRRSHTQLCLIGCVGATDED